MNNSLINTTHNYQVPDKLDTSQMVANAEMNKTLLLPLNMIQALTSCVLEPDCILVGTFLRVKVMVEI